MILWEILSLEIQYKLRAYQIEHFGTALSVMFEHEVEVEDLEEIARIMERAPSKSRGEE